MWRKRTLRMMVWLSVEEEDGGNIMSLDFVCFMRYGCTLDINYIIYCKLF